jgi:hypothetical protein
MAASLRTVVVSANGFLSRGSRRIADSTSTAATAPTIPASDPSLGMRATVFPHVVRRCP